MNEAWESLRGARQHVDKPWGGFDRYTLNQTCTVKILTIAPHQALSLQTHERRDELWVVIEGDPEIQVEDMVYPPAAPGQEFFIPCYARHRLTTGARHARILEISLGEFDEEDVTRHEDRYGRR
jgi:mannose-1-phosphate guanylyltransferase/mannose-6-phosphate isomerase